MLEWLLPTIVIIGISVISVIVVISKRMNDQAPAPPQNVLPNVTKRTTEYIRLFEKHWKITWYTHNALVVTSIITTLSVPFGLAGLLYNPDETQRSALNKLLLTVSAVAAISQIVDHILGLRTRAERLRRWAETLKQGLSLFQDGKIEEPEFLAIYKSVSKEFADEDAV